MAVTNGRGWYRFAVAGDTVTGKLHITSIVASVGAVAATAAAPITIKDGDGDTIASLSVPVESFNTISVDTVVDGIELDALPAGGTITVFVQ